MDLLHISYFLGYGRFIPHCYWERLDMKLVGTEDTLNVRKKKVTTGGWDWS